MVVKVNAQIKKDLSSDFSTIEYIESGLLCILEYINKFQNSIRKHIDGSDKNLILDENITNADSYIADGESLLRETKHLMLNLGNDGRLSLSESNSELKNYADEFREASLGLQISTRILEIHNLFQRIDDLNASRNYLAVFDLLGKLKSLLCSERSSDIDRLFQKCDCFDAIKVKYHIQANITQLNLKQRFEGLVQFSEKDFASAKHVTLQISTDVAQLEDTVMALFQARYNPMEMCDFILNKCLIPMITKPSSVESCTNNSEYIQLNISYSLKNLNKSLRPSYKPVLDHIMKLFTCLTNLNIRISTHRYVFTVIGSHIKERFLMHLVDDCLMHAVPETIDEYQESTLPADVLQFEKSLANIYFIDSKEDTALSDFVLKYDEYFQQKFTAKILENALSIMQKDLQDMTPVSECSTLVELENNSIFPPCMVSKSIVELVKLMERILKQPIVASRSNESHELHLSQDIHITLNKYCSEVPKLHENLLKCIPQQAALFYNNCMFLAHWVTNNSEMGGEDNNTLVNVLQTTGARIFKAQETHQQSLLSQILKHLDISDTHSIGLQPMKVIRQCLRQMDLLKNVWLHVLPDSLYTVTICNMLDNVLLDILNRILSLEDISANVASELSELIDVILLKIPELYKEKQQLQVTNRMKLQQLKYILNASLHDITEQWCGGAGILTANYTADEVRQLIRALFQNTDRRAKALAKIV